MKTEKEWVNQQRRCSTDAPGPTFEPTAIHSKSELVGEVRGVLWKTELGVGVGGFSHCEWHENLLVNGILG